MNIVSQSKEIRDLGLAAALITSGFNIIATTKKDNGRAYFIFSSTDDLESTINEYWSNELVIQARSYSDNIKMLKSRIYSTE